MSSQGLKVLLSEDPEMARQRQPVEERFAMLNGTADFHWISNEFCRLIDEGVRTGDPSGRLSLSPKWRVGGALLAYRGG
jgi:hypothetical protein